MKNFFKATSPIGNTNSHASSIKLGITGYKKKPHITTAENIRYLY